MRDPQFKEMLNLLAMLKKGFCDGMKVRIGRLQNLISSSCIGKFADNFPSCWYSKENYELKNQASDNTF